MTDTLVPSYDQFVLPPSVVTRVDISRLVSEMEQLDNDLRTIAVRAKSGVSEHTQPRLSDQMNDFMVANQLQVGAAQQRAELIKQLRLLKDNVPNIHMTFASTADNDSLGQVVSWLRQKIHPQTTLTVGLQPGIIGGAYIRTPNHVHDLSLRAQLAKSRHLLVEAVEAVNAGK